MSIFLSRWSGPPPVLSGCSRPPFPVDPDKRSNSYQPLASDDAYPYMATDSLPWEWLKHLVEQIFFCGNREHSFSFLGSIHISLGWLVYLIKLLLCVFTVSSTRLLTGERPITVVKESILFPFLLFSWKYSHSIGVVALPFTLCLHSKF